ncbi:DUF2779 domain-containing protein [Mycoplasmopsis felifaucium]|uniref:DUF2779 domain-containing protein n=1 Tax=Mycoplasmopsis felifaucium TaxID=35768 RepID=A0ABZ2RSD2_9BACT
MKFKDKKINENKYIKSFYCQDYFLWHTSDEFKNQYMSDNTFDFDDFNNSEDDDGDNSEKIWGLYFDNFAESNTTKNNPSKIFNKITEQANTYILQGIFNNKNVSYIPLNIDLTGKMQLTQKLLNDKNVDVIFNATFGYSTTEDFLIHSSQYAYDKTDKTIYLFKPFPKTTIKTLLSADFAYNVFKKSTQLEPNNIKAIIVDNLLPLKQDKSNFFITECCGMSKDPSEINNERLQKLNDKLIGTFFDGKDKEFVNNYYRKGLQYSGQHYEILVSKLEKQKIYEKQKYSYLDCIKGRQVLRNITLSEAKDKEIAFFCFQKANSTIINEEINLGNFDNTINRIQNAYTVNNVNFDILDPYYDNPVPISLDYSEFGQNDELLKTYKKYIITDDKWMNGNVNDSLKGKFFEKKSPKSSFDKYYSNLKTSKQMPDFFKREVVEKYLSLLHQKDCKIVWYDYESFTSPLPVFDNFRPYRQVINQVSIIETINGKIVDDSQEDIVVDPKTIQIIDLVKILKKLYDRQANYYIVFNKTFENSRNQEIAKLASENSNNTIFVKSLKTVLNINTIDVQLYANYINDRTIDLMDLFKSAKSNPDVLFKFKLDKNNTEEIELPTLNKNSILVNNIDANLFANPEFVDKILNFNIFLKDLKCLFSIKKVEKLITSKKIKLEHLITPYSELEEIHNGGNAMEAAIKRYCGITGDNVWNNTVVNLKKYCHNDVLAMIMAFNFAEKIVSDLFPEINQLKYTFDNTKQYFINTNTNKIELVDK